MNTYKLAAVLIVLITQWALMHSAHAVVAQGMVVTGLQPNMSVTLKRPGQTPQTATTNDKGELRVTQDENDDDPNAVYWRRGTQGFGDLYDDNGKRFVLLEMRPGGFFEATSVSAAAPATGASNVSYEGGGAFGEWQDDGIEDKVALGVSAANRDGFAALDSTSDTADSYSFYGRVNWDLSGGGLKPQTSGVFTQISHWRGDKIDGGFVANNVVNGNNLQVVSEGSQEIQGTSIEVGAFRFLTRGLRFDIAAGVGSYETTDKSRQRYFVNSVEQSAISSTDRQNDRAGSVAIGAYYFVTDNLAIGANHRWLTSNIGEGDFIKPRQYRVSIGFRF